MRDILFDTKDDQTFVKAGESTRTHQQDILLMHKGWNKFFPHVGVGIIDYLDNEVDGEALESSIASEMERDGMEVKNIVFGNDGKITIDANY